jgi:hypothetical protein
LLTEIAGVMASALVFAIPGNSNGRTVLPLA